MKTQFYLKGLLVGLGITAPASVILSLVLTGYILLSDAHPLSFIILEVCGWGATILTVIGFGIKNSVKP